MPKKQFIKKSSTSSSSSKLRNRKKMGKLVQYKRKNAFSKKGVQMSKLGFCASNFPPTLWTTFSYNTNKNLDTTGIYYHTFIVNNLYDPDATILKQLSPRYFSTLLGADGGTAPYQNYRVHAFKMTCKVGNTSTWPIAISITTNRSTVSVPATLNEAYERSDTVVRNLGALTSGDSMKTITISGKVKNYLSHKDLRDIDGASAYYSNAPSEQVQSFIRLWPMDRVSNVTAICDTKITFFSELYTLNDVSDD